MYFLKALVTAAAVVAAAYVPATKVDDVSFQTLLERIELMESRHAKAIELMETKHAEAFKSVESKHAGTMQSLESKHAEAMKSAESKYTDAMQSIDTRHAEEIQRLTVKHDEDIQTLSTRVEKCEIAIISSVDKLSATEEGKAEETYSRKDDTELSGHGTMHATNLSEHGEMKVMGSMSRRNSGHSNVIRTPIRRLYEGNNIAFSAYLEHALTGVGTDQVIVMNQVLLNDGNGYNRHTGIFTAPMDGVYSFSFFIFEGGSHQLFVRLTVNSTPEVDAVVDTTYHNSQDAQGGNTVNLKLSAGDAVMLKHSRTGVFSDTDHLEGNANARLTTFSGFLLYPTDSAPIIGK